MHWRGGERGFCSPPVIESSRAVPFQQLCSSRGKAALMLVSIRSFVWFTLAVMHQSKTQKYSRVISCLLPVIHSWFDLFVYVFCERNITSGKTDDPGRNCAHFVTPWHNTHRHALTSAIGSCPEIITLLKAEALLSTVSPLRAATFSGRVPI